MLAVRQRHFKHQVAGFHIFNNLKIKNITAHLYDEKYL